MADLMVHRDGGRGRRMAMAGNAKDDSVGRALTLSTCKQEYLAGEGSMRRTMIDMKPIFILTALL